MHTVRTYWVEAPHVGRLGVVSMPRAVSDYAALRAAGVDVLVSMLESEEAHAVGLGAAEAHCRAAGIEFHTLPIADHGLPDTVAEVVAMTAVLKARLAAGKTVAAHCFAGLGRSPLMIASVLIDHGMGATQACDLVSAARGHRVPEMETQERWLADFAARRG